MTSAQKVIKYIATAFAILLIASIISGILTGGFALLSAVGLIKANDSVADNLSVISNEIKEVASLNIELDCTNLEIISRGASYEIYSIIKRY